MTLENIQYTTTRSEQPVVYFHTHGVSHHIKYGISDFIPEAHSFTEVSNNQHTNV